MEKKLHRETVKPFHNVYDDKTRAEAYDSLEFPGTYYLAYRDLPALIGKHVQGKMALDFGCGTGRSTRFLRKLGFDVIGVDISEQMIALARKRDPDGDYRLISVSSLGGLEAGAYDLVLCAFTFDNVPAKEKALLFKSLNRLLAPQGRMVNVVSAPEIYIHEWTSFSTKDFPGNKTAKSGGKVFIVMLDVNDNRPVEDVLWTHHDYLETYDRAGLVPVTVHRPLGNQTEPYRWVNETKISPWAVYVLRRANAIAD